ncbi:hypothetical protein [Sinimarinibacterium sp. NLF-5-8]|uniref:hypothetical protein n=1 Tax=Sinimarinibacterium sp. NLF-5-8 TaxID=2698684 RepID=UPI00137C25ED|nr:hypothetical protein [Sinimarinibacterium sp. NLF-5-8]QHS09032.1 hypothetical protein GT972_01990 [Sinimarinibacterium sp. NLF-5-8]
MAELTQEKVNEMFAEVRAEWDKRVSESGRSEKMFIAMDSTGFVAVFLYQYQRVKEYVESRGLVMPELVKGLKVSYTSQPSEAASA